MRWWVMILGLASCTKSVPNAPPSPREPAPGRIRFEVSRSQWPEASARGVSGLARLDGRFLAGPETDRALIPFRVTERGTELEAPLPLVGLPEDLDVEALAALPNGRIAIGTEAKDHARKSDPIYFASVGSSVKVEEAIRFSYEHFEIRADGNRGIEAVCATDGRIIAAAETVIEAGARYAPLGSYDLTTKKWAYYRLRLTSDKGKISGLACETSGRHRRLVAIERHYEVARILEVKLPLMETGGDVLAEVLFDLTDVFEEMPPNFEAIEILQDGRLLLIADNHYGTVSGPTEILMVRPPPRQELRVRPGARVE